MTAYLAYSYSTYNYAENVNNSQVININRSTRRKWKRLINKYQDDIIKSKKLSMVLGVANPAIPIPTENNRDETLLELFLQICNQTFKLFLKLSQLIFEFLKKNTTALYKASIDFIKQHPFFTSFLGFMGCLLLILHFASKKFGVNAQRYNRLVSFILFIIAILLFSWAIKLEAFNTILEWLRSILSQILFILKSTNMFFDRYKQDSTVSTTNPNFSKSKGKSELRDFIFFSVLSIIATKIGFEFFKRDIVGDGPFRDLIIEIMNVEIFDINDYLPEKLKFK